MRRPGMTLVELCVGMLVSIVAIGIVTGILWQGMNIVGANAAYSMALRGATASFEFLPKEIGYSNIVQIMDEGHVVSDEALRKDGWRYIVLKKDRLFEIFWDGGRVEKALTGSEYLTSVDFVARLISPDGAGGEMLGVSLWASASDSLATDKKIELHRNLLIRASDGVTGTRGPILRYLPEPAPEPDLELFSGDMYGGASTFASSPASWKSVDFDDYAALKGRLIFTRGNVGDEVTFKWILCDASLIDSPVQPVKKDSLSLKQFFENDRISLDVRNAEKGDFREKGAIRVLETMTVAEQDAAFSDAWKLPSEPEDVLGKYAVLAAVYTPKGRTVSDYWPVLVKVGDIESDPLFSRINDTFRDRKNGLPGEYSDLTSPDRNIIRVSDGWGEEIFNEHDNENRGSVTLLGQNPSSNATMKVANVLTPEYFRHLDNSVYGVTNYAVYIDAALANGVGGGYGILLNGQVSGQKNGKGVFEATGYVFQVDPALNGFTIRYFAKNNTVYSPVASFGSRTMYIYDAQKAFPSPRNVFSVGNTGEDFSQHEGARPGANIFHRMPLFGNQSDVYSASLLTNVGESRKTDTSYNLNYGMTLSPYGAALYSPKLIQTWNSDPEQGGYSQSRGFRWDDIWKADYNDAQSRANWYQRHILKLTILELTQNVPSSKLAPETWRAASEGGYQAGDIILRAELILMKDPTKSIYDSKNYVYSKPMWFGKFKGDGWRAGGSSVFKKMGNTMMHNVAVPEPGRGDKQSFRRRGMRVRSWLEAVDASHPDYTAGEDKIWTPPIAVDLNKRDTVQNQGHVFGSYTFADYTDTKTPVVSTDSNGAYTGAYMPMAYGRLSWLRQNQNSAPLYGLYALRGWDNGYNGSADDTGAGVATPTKKRFLSVVQGMQLAYNKAGSGLPAYDKKRERSFAIRSWSTSTKQNVGLTLYDTWIGEGFSIDEIRKLLGLDAGQFPTDASVHTLIETEQGLR